MVKQQTKVNSLLKRNPSAAALVIVLIMAALGVIIYLASLPKAHQPVPNSISDRNLQIWDEAKSKHDPAICDQIINGINAEAAPSGARGNHYPRPAYTESEARAQCRKTIN